jgi:hypothetical protein
MSPGDKSLMRICAFFAAMLLFGIAAWFIVDPVDLRSWIDHYLLAPLIGAFAALMLILVLWERLSKR